MNIHVYLHDGDDHVKQQLSQLTIWVQQLLAQGAKMDATVTAKFDELRAAVAAETTVIASAKTLLDGLAAQIAALKAAAANSSPEVLAAIDDLETAVTTNKDALAAAVLADTPGA